MIGTRSLFKPSLYQLLAVLPLALALSSCSSGTSLTAAAPAFTIAPVITAFSGGPANINVGQSTQLTWSVYGATSVSLSNGTTTTTSPTSPLTVTPAVTTTYTLTATNAIGTSTYSTTVTVLQLPVISSFTATPPSVTAGSSSVLAWTVSGETTLSLATTVGTATTSAVESIASTGVTVTPASSASYTLTATNAAGTATATAGVAVTPLIKTFTATPSTVTAGQPVTLAWTTTGATTYQISGVSGTLTSSSVIVYPAASTTYTLTATGAGTTSTTTASVTVSSASALDTSATVTPGSPGSFAVPPSFTGLSIGSTSYQAILGIPATGTNKIYRQLLTNLTAPFNFNAAASSNLGPIVLRIGGNSADGGVIPSATTVSALSQLAKDSGVQFILGVSLEPDVVTTAVQQAQAYTTNMPSGSILGIEVGNEPDLYVQNGERSSPYNYVADFANFQSALAAAGVSKVVGPAWSNSPSLAGMPAFLASQKANLSVVTQHAYGGNICPTSSGITLAADYSLQETAQANAAAVSLSTGGTASVNLVHAAGLPYRIGETNTINCSGQLGVSNTFQAALWSLDWSSRLAANGVDGVNFFGDNDNNYSLFIFNSSTSGAGAVTYSITAGSIRPQYYGLLMFQQATQNSAKFLPVSYSTTANLKTYAWLDAAGNIRVLVLNKDESAGGVFSVTVPGYGNARLTRLTAPLYTSTTGVLYNGQTLDTSTDGTLQGAPYGEIIAPSAGVYSFAMPITSAVLLEIPHN